MIENEHNISRLREERSNYKKRFNELSSHVAGIIQSLTSTHMPTPIMWSDLQSFPIGSNIIVNDKVTFIKMSENNNQIVFTTNMKAMSDFGVHLHPDSFEIIDVVKGNLIETKRGDKEYIEGDIIVYAPREIHHPMSSKESEYVVTFKKSI